MVTSAPDIVTAVVVPDFRTRLPELFVKAPYCVPASLRRTSAPSASRIISPEASIVASPVAFTVKSVEVTVTVSEPEISKAAVAVTVSLLIVVLSTVREPTVTASGRPMVTPEFVLVSSTSLAVPLTFAFV